MIRNVKIAPSSTWLQNALRTVGLRPRNNIVDITNFVMLECGQPMHAFDYSQLQGKKIIVRQTRAGSKFTTLDDKEHELPADTVMVCDAQREVSIAGIMGGQNSEISDTTTDIVLESAYWKPSSIRRTAKALGITSDAAYRFERGADPNASEYALDRAAQLILEMAGGELLKGRIDVYPKRIRPKVVSLRTNRCNEVLGTSLSTSKVIKILTKLSITRGKSTNGNVLFKVPTYRVDINREIDLIEEVARVYGYNNIESKTISAIDFNHPLGKEVLADQIRELLVGFGYLECLTISIQDEQTARLAGVNPVRLVNQLGSGMSALRSSLIPGLLQAAAHNQRHGNTDLRLFEIGHVFEETAEQQLVGRTKEVARLCLLLCGKDFPRYWKGKSDNLTIYDVKGEVADLLDACGLDSWRYIYYPNSETLADNPIFVEINATNIGFMGSVKEEICKRFGFEGEAFVVELNLSHLKSNRLKKYIQLPKFPKVLRDIALTLDAGVEAGRIEQCLRDSGSTLLHDVELFDLYEGENLPAGKKSLAFTLVLVSHEKTLTDAEIDTEVQRIVNKVQQEFNATLRHN